MNCCTDIFKTSEELLQRNSLVPIWKDSTINSSKIFLHFFSELLYELSKDSFPKRILELFSTDFHIKKRRFFQKPWKILLIFFFRNFSNYFLRIHPRIASWTSSEIPKNPWVSFGISQGIPQYGNRRFLIIFLQFMWKDVRQRLFWIFI